MYGRVWRAAALGVTGLATAILLAGCTLPDGIDGDFTDGWAGFPQPVGFVPAAGACHAGGYQETTTLADYQPVPCTEPHRIETVYVGEFTEAAADLPAPPPTGSAEWQEAFLRCDEAAAEYLGADFRSGLLWLGVSVPSAAAWEGGARWFRCDAHETEEVGGSGARDRSESLAGALADGSELALGCFDVEVDPEDDTRITAMNPIGCDQAHHAEFVGIWFAPDGPYVPIDGDDEDTDPVHAACLELVAEYVDVPVDGDLDTRSGTIATWIDEADWENGDRGYRCYLYLDEGGVTDSLEGAGPEGLPIQ